MQFAGIDLIVLIVSLLILLLNQLLKAKLPDDLLLKNDKSRVMFSISKTRGLWLISGSGIYVWLMDFLILNSNLKLRLVSPLAVQVALFFGLIITNLGYRKLGKILALLGLIFFIGSVVYYA